MTHASLIVICLLIVSFVDCKSNCAIFTKVLNLISKEDSICKVAGYNNVPNGDIDKQERSELETQSKAIKKTELLASCVYKQSLDNILSPLDKSGFKKIESKLSTIAAGCSIDRDFCESRIRDSIASCSDYITQKVDADVSKWLKKNCKTSNTVAPATLKKAIKISVTRCLEGGAYGSRLF